MSQHVRSPLEHGELEGSPFYSPEMDIDINIVDDSHISEVDSNEPDSPRPDDEEELGPDIKPPQTKIKKDKHKHKHKRKSGDRDRDRYGDRGSKQSNRGSTGDGTRSKEMKDRSGARASGSRRESGSNMSERDRRARLIRQREEELARREKSLQERERLEKLEMERRRLDREISKREQEQRDKIRREREADRQQRMERNRARMEKEDTRRTSTRQNIQIRNDRNEYNRVRSRSPPMRRSDYMSQDRWQKTSRNDHVPDRNRPRSVLNQPLSQSSHVEMEKDHSDQSNKTKTEVTSDDSESDSDDSTSGGSVSGSDSSSGEEKEKSKVKHTEHMKVKSRFDSESEHDQSYESDKDSFNRSDQDDRYGEYNEYLDETPPQSPIELKPDLPPYYPAIQGCRNVEEFNCLYRIEEGTYGVVYGARDKKTDEIVALKRLKMEKEKDGFPITSLREINTLLKAQHPNIVTVREIVVGSNMDRIYIVMDYVEHDLKDLMRRMREPFMIGEVKTLMIQLLRGVAHMHDNWIIHRDLKTSNLLLSHSGILKIGDFGLAREYGSPLKPYTPIVVTLWYRSPELLLGTKEYSCPIDLWSVGCIMAEFLTREALFPGKSEIDELNRIFKALGTPNESIWPGVSQLKGWKICSFADYPYNQLKNKFGGMITEKGFDLMNRFLTYDPSKRITAEEALKHEWFKESPAPIDPSMFPTWPTKNEQSIRPKTGNSPKPPSGGKAYSLLNDDDESLGFHLKNATTGGGGFSLKF